MHLFVSPTRSTRQLFFRFRKPLLMAHFLLHLDNMISSLTGARYVCLEIEESSIRYRRQTRASAVSFLIIARMSVLYRLFIIRPFIWSTYCFTRICHPLLCLASPSQIFSICLLFEPVKGYLKMPGTFRQLMHIAGS